MISTPPCSTLQASPPAAYCPRTVSNRNVVAQIAKVRLLGTVVLLGLGRGGRWLRGLLRFSGLRRFSGLLRFSSLLWLSSLLRFSNLLRFSDFLWLSNLWWLGKFLWFRVGSSVHFIHQNLPAGSAS